MIIIIIIIMLTYISVIILKLLFTMHISKLNITMLCYCFGAHEAHVLAVLLGHRLVVY